MKRYTIEQFMSSDHLLGGSFRADGERLLYSSDASGIVNIHELEIATGETRQLTHSRDHAYQLLASLPTGEGFVYAADNAGDELSHLFLHTEDGEDRDLTPWPGVRSQCLAISADGRFLDFECNRRTPRESDFYRLDLETLEISLLFENQASYSFGGVSRDGRFLCLRMSFTAYDSDLFLLDLQDEDQEIRLLTPHEGEMLFHPASFSPDSSSLYLLSDRDSSFLRLWNLDLTSGDQELVFEHPGHVTSCRFSPDGQVRVLCLDRDGQSWLDLEGLREGVEIPDFQANPEVFSPCGRYLSCYQQGDRNPPSLEVLDLHQTGEVCARVEALNPEVQAEDLVEGEHVLFPSSDGLEVPGILYRPHGEVREPGQRPGLVFVHGGPGGQFRHIYHGLRQFLIHCGYTILAVNNRGSSGYSKEFFRGDYRTHGNKDLEDCLAAREELIRAAGVDPERVGIIGGSYGGFLVLAAQAFRPGVFTCGVDIFGVSNWLRTLAEMPVWWGPSRAALFDKIGDPVADEEYLRSISPLFHAERIVSPLLVLQGAKDPRVVQAESDEIVAAVRGNDVLCDYLLFEDEGHGFLKKKNEIEGYRTIREFLDRHLLS